MMARLFVLAALLAAALPAASPKGYNGTTGGWLRDMCTSEHDPARLSLCIGYIEGVLDGFAYGQMIVLEPNDPVRLHGREVFLRPGCFRPSVLELQDFVVNHLGNRPGELDSPAVISLTKELGALPPCQHETQPREP